MSRLGGLFMFGGELLRLTRPAQDDTKVSDCRVPMNRGSQ